MHRNAMAHDIRPLAEFSDEVSSCIKHVQDSHRPMLITEDGKGLAVLLDVDEYQAMMVRLAILEDLQIAEIEMAAGLGLSHEEAIEQVKSGLPK